MPSGTCLKQQVRVRGNRQHLLNSRLSLRLHQKNGHLAASCKSPACQLQLLPQHRQRDHNHCLPSVVLQYRSHRCFTVDLWRHRINPTQEHFPLRSLSMKWQLRDCMLSKECLPEAKSAWKKGWNRCTRCTLFDEVILPEQPELWEQIRCPPRTGQPSLQACQLGRLQFQMLQDR